MVQVLSSLKRGGKVKVVFESIVSQSFQLNFRMDKSCGCCFTAGKKGRAVPKDALWSRHQEAETRNLALLLQFWIPATEPEFWNHGKCKQKPVITKQKICSARKKKKKSLQNFLHINWYQNYLPPKTNHCRWTSSYTGASLNELILSAFQLAPDYYCWFS